MKPVSYLNALELQHREVSGFLEEVDRELHPHLLRIAEKTPAVSPLREGVFLQITGGKRRLRAAFCTTACELFSGSYREALYFAAAIEHLQNAILIHDEITRYGDEKITRQSLLQRFGIGQTINIGDAFISLATLAIAEAPYSTELKLKLLELLCDQSFESAEGLNLDINLRTNDDPAMGEYLTCAKKKTGTFLAMAAKGGAIIGGAGNDMIHLLNNYAVLAGVAFEVGEEILDARGPVGWSKGRYIREGRRTLLSIHAAGQASAKEREQLFFILNKRKITVSEEDVDWVLDLYKKTDAIKYAEGIVRTITKNSFRYVNKVPESPAKAKMLRISRYYSQRLHLNLFPGEK